ncbi:hypothetical protein [Asanoa siamensis]|uniref:Uncharacterized protein n=1 Tax=Asanoa siamensis TaxID=926357 RepID=A0ABQ4CTR8_9ACTN|nr:hypothetical protein [Asanoa siamensis]GIF74683.1 hypothetical protein Asi02nite_42010 [Asanoa siamensis]
MTQPTLPPGTPTPMPPGYGQPPYPSSTPVWPWLVGGAALFALILCLGGAGLFVALRDGSPPPARAARDEPVAPRPSREPVAPGLSREPVAERTRLPDPPRVLGRDVTISGRGDKTVEVRLEPDAAYVATITYTGTGNFLVEALDESGRQVGLIVNAIDDYAGDRTIGLQERGIPAAFQVRATGTWKIVLRDLSKAPAFTGEAAGRKPAVFLVPSGTATGQRLTVSHSGRSNFVVRGYGHNDRIGLFVNEIGRYQGTEPLPPDTQVLEVEAQGGWTLRFT